MAIGWVWRRSSVPDQPFFEQTHRDASGVWALGGSQFAGGVGTVRHFARVKPVDGNATPIPQSDTSLSGKGANPAMKKKKLALLGIACAAAAIFAVGVRGEAAEEVKRLAELMGWNAGIFVADIGAGDGKYTFAAVERVGAAGKVYATEIDAKKLAELKEEVARRKLANVIVVESKEAETNL